MEGTDGRQIGPETPIKRRNHETPFSRVQDTGPLHTGEIPLDLLLRHRDDHRRGGDLRLCGEDRRLHGAQSPAEGDRLRLLPELHPLLHQPVQRSVHLHRRDLLHLEDGLPDRDRRHALGRHVVPAPHVALLPRGAGHLGPVDDAEPVDHPRYAALDRGLREQIPQEPPVDPVRPSHLPSARTGDVRLHPRLLRPVEAGAVLRSGTLRRQHHDPFARSRRREARPRIQTLDRQPLHHARVRLAGHGDLHAASWGAWPTSWRR